MTRVVLISVVLALTIVYGCKDNDVAIAPDAFLQIRDSSFMVSYTSGTKDILIESNVNWTISSDASWLTTSRTSGFGTNGFELAWEELSENTNRAGTITISAESIEKKLMVFQFAHLTLVSMVEILGNNENGSQDSVHLVFNKAIPDSLFITTRDQTCSERITYTIKGNKLSFSYGCSKLGGEDSFDVWVYDGPDQFHFELKMQFYTKKSNVPGFVIDYFLAEDNASIWAITKYPNKVIQLAVPDLTVLYEYDLDFEPQRIKWNRYHNKLNIFNYSSSCTYEDLLANNCNRNFIVYLDPGNSSITNSKIKLIPGFDADHFNYPYVFPQNICQFDNGMGIIQLTNVSNYQRWRFIDSSQADSTFISQSHLNLTDRSYDQILSNYDYSKIYMKDTYTSNIDIYEVGSSAFSTYTPPYGANFLLSNKRSKRVFSAGFFHQVIFDLEGYVSKVSYFNPIPWYGGLDFSYEPGDDEVIYYLADGTFQILDYTKAFTNLSTDALSKLTKIQTASDGVYFTALIENGEGNTDFYVFNTDLLTSRIPGSNSGGRIRPTDNRESHSAWKKK